jgi:hypothetical protein
VLPLLLVVSGLQKVLMVELVVDLVVDIVVLDVLL